MGWEKRSQQHYYYRKRRIGQRVISEYIGSGAAADDQARQDAEDRERRERDRAAWRRSVQEVRMIDGELDQVEGMVKALLRVHLLAAGYHQSKGVWRKRRDGKHPTNNDDY